MINLRIYQQHAIEEITAFFKQGGKHAILQAQTGAGKTIIFSELARLVSNKNNKVIIFTDRVELLNQAGGSLKKVGLNAFYIEAGCKVVSNNFNCYIAMSQTFRRRIKEPYWIEFLNSCNLVIIDEQHKQEFNYLFESGLLENKHVLGFTATPKRAGKMRQLGLDYEKIIETISVKELINQGYLVNDDYYGIASPDLEGVEIDRMKGDYKEGQLFKKFDTPQLYSGVVSNYSKICPGTKTLVFCVNIEHSIKTAIEFHNAGIPVKFIVSDVSKPTLIGDGEGEKARYEERMRVWELYQEWKSKLSGERSSVFGWFDKTKGSILVNAGIATTGFDQPDIETIILNRATMSLTLLLQMLGRGSRISESKTHFNVLDFGGNCDRLGYYSEDREWHLWHEENNGGGLPPIKECGFDSKGKPITGKGGCRRLILASYKICPFCGFKYPEKTHAEIDLDAVLFDYSQKRSIKTKLIKDMTFYELNEYRKSKGHQMAWLWRQLWYKGGEKAISDFGFQFGWTHATVEKAVGFCRRM